MGPLPDASGQQNQPVRPTLSSYFRTPAIDRDTHEPLYWRSGGRVWMLCVTRPDHPRMRCVVLPRNPI